MIESIDKLMLGIDRRREIENWFGHDMHKSGWDNMAYNKNQKNLRDSDGNDDRIDEEELN